MDITPSVTRDIFTHGHTTGYETDENYIECLATCTESYTSSTIDTESTRIPLMIRATADNPFHNDSTKFWDPEKSPDKEAYTESYLNHASAVIPATNGAFWVIYPYWKDLTKIGDTTKDKVHQAVRYYPANAKNLNDYITCPAIGERYRPVYLNQEWNGAATFYTPEAARLIHDHPCGATYINLSVPIHLDSVVVEELKPKQSSDGITDRIGDLTDFFTMGNKKTVYSSSGQPSTQKYVDVLVCCGGYTVQVKNGKIVTTPNTVLRFYVATPTAYHINTSVYEGPPAEINETPVIWQTILIAEYDGQGFVFKQDSYRHIPFGASLVKLDSENDFAVIGGYHIGNFTNDNTIRINPHYVAYPYTEYHLSVKADKQLIYNDKDKTGYVWATFNHIYISQTHRDGTYNKTYSYREYKTAIVSCLNPASNICIKNIDTEKNPLYHPNSAPTMYPVPYYIGGCVLAYGAEFFHVDHNTTYNYNWNLSLLMYKHLFPSETASDENKWVNNVPLLNCQYLIVKNDLVTNRYALNVSGTLGVGEGALAIPTTDALIIVGGVSSRHLAPAGSLRFHSGNHKDSKHKSNLQNIGTYLDTTKTVDDLNVTQPTYKSTDILTIPLFSKIIRPGSVSFNNPYQLGIDTIKYDCLYSQVVQMGDTDYFIAPSSLFEYDNDAVLPNATLIKRVKPVAWDDPKLEGKSQEEKYIMHNSYIRVSEVIGLPVYKESMDNYQHERPCYYGHANVAKASIGCIPEENENGEYISYWYYKLGNGIQDAQYHRIFILKSVKSLTPVYAEMKLNLETYPYDATDQTLLPSLW